MVSQVFEMRTMDYLVDYSKKLYGHMLSHLLFYFF